MHPVPAVSVAALSAAGRELAALAEVAAQVCRVPTAWVSLLDGSHWAAHTAAARRHKAPTAAAKVLNDRACQGDGLLEVADTRTDPRFASHPQVSGDPYTRFYAGLPLRMNDGTAVGTLCVMDNNPRELSPTQRGFLYHLAAAAALALEAEAQSPSALQIPDTPCTESVNDSDFDHWAVTEPMPLVG